MKSVIILVFAIALAFNIGCSGNEEASDTDCIPKSVMGQSPVYLTITDPDGLVISDEKNEIEGSIYYPDETWIGDRKPGQYLITVTPKEWACPDEVFNITVSPMEHKFGYTPIVIVQNVKIRDIPDEPYVYEFKEREGSEIVYTGETICEYRGTASLSAVLTDSEGAPIENKTVSFAIGYQSVTAQTGSNGVAEASLNLSQGPSSYYYIETNFDGDIDYLPNYNTSFFEILEPEEGTYEHLDGDWTNYTSEDGLPEDWVSVLYGDSEDNVWLGGEGSVTKFNGHSFTTYDTGDGLTDELITAISTDKDNNLWVASQNGVSRFDGEDWTSFSSEDGLPSGIVQSIACDSDGNMWFGTGQWESVFGAWNSEPSWYYSGNGTTRFDGDTWTTYTVDDGLAGNNVMSIACDGEGNVWFGTNSGVSRFDGSTWTTYTTDDGLISNSVTAIAIDEEGNVWFGTNSGVSRFDGAHWTNYIPVEYNFNIPIEGEVYPTIARSFEIDVDGSIWLNTLTAGGLTGWVSRFDGEYWYLYTATEGLPEYGIYAMEIDENNDLWFATLEGLYRLERE
jgi:streptogramin lyase